MLIEAGLIQPNGVAKLHNYLDDNIDYGKRREEGYHLVSGHLARNVHVVHNNVSFKGSIALLDQITNLDLQTDIQRALTNSLRWINILPISADGHPILQ